MTDVWLTYEQTVDPPACNLGPNDYNRISRDPARTPLQWDDTQNAGFSTSKNKTWLPVATNYREVNIKAQKLASRSHLKVYQDLIRLRQTDILQFGDVRVKAFNENILGIWRYLNGTGMYITVINFGYQREYVDLNDFGELPEQMHYKVIGVSSAHIIGDTVKTSEVAVEPYESFVLQFLN